MVENVNMENSSTFSMIGIWIRNLKKRINSEILLPVEYSSTDMHGWNTQVRKTQVHVCSGRKRKYENGLSDVDMTGK